MRALVWDVSVPRYVATLATGRRVPSLMYGALSSLVLRDDVPLPALPGDDWAELAPIQTGLCGTDLSFLQFKASPLLSVFESSPSVLGHEIVARVVAAGRGVTSVREGDRVVVDPVLTCETRGLPACQECARGRYGTCERHSDGQGAILGYSRAYPGGFSERMVAHRSQLFRVPDSVDDDRAVLAEPVAVAVHAVMQNAPRDGEAALVIGSGIIAQATVWALRALHPSVRVAASCREPYQRALARALGAKVTLGDDGERDVRRAAAADLGARELVPKLGRGFLTRGYDRVYDCAGNAESLSTALSVVGAGGSVVLVGAAGKVPDLDLTTVWSREQRVLGSVYYGFEQHRGERRRTFEVALELLSDPATPIESLVTHKLPLERYREAIRVSLERRVSRCVKATLRA